jgi:hypothetical protein
MLSIFRERNRLFNLYANIEIKNKANTDKTSLARMKSYLLSMAKCSDQNLKQTVKESKFICKTKKSSLRQQSRFKFTYSDFFRLLDFNYL